MPGLEVARADARPRETVTAFLRRTGWATRDRKYGWQFRKGLPTILEINGEAVLRKDWRRRRIGARAEVRFVSYPLGGAGGGSAKQVAGLIALVAVSAFAFWAGPLISGALGFTGAFAGGLATAAIGLGGSLLVNALISPKQGATNAPSATQDQIYSVLAQGNVAKLGQPLPVWYGRLKAFPDFAATPWATLDPAPTWDTGPFHIRLRMPDGKFFGPVLTARGANNSLAVLGADSLAAAERSQSTTLSAVLAREDGSLITINGLPCSIPAGGVSLAPTGLTAGTTYYIYALATAGVLWRN